MRGWIVGALLAIAVPLAAQESESASGTSAAPEAAPMDHLIGQAIDALNNLDYPQVIDIATTLLDAGAEGRADIEVTALQLLAAAHYPDEEDAQQPSTARAYLQRLVWTGPETTIPQVMTWPGLDSLLDATRRETFVVYARPPTRSSLRGVEASTALPVEVTRASAIRLVARRLPGGDPVLLDSIGSAHRGRLRVRPVVADELLLPTGDYELTVSATEVATGATVSRSYEMVVAASDFALLALPEPPTVDDFLPERTSRNKVRTLAIGVGIGLATGLIAGTLRADSPADLGTFDGRALLVGGAMSGAAVLGGWFDPGHELPSNVAHNARVRSNHVGAMRSIEEENDTRRRTFGALVTIGRERR